MKRRSDTVVGIDVGGKKKGLHAFALQHGGFDKLESSEPKEILRWCVESKAAIVAVDAPSG